MYTWKKQAKEKVKMSSTLYKELYKELYKRPHKNARKLFNHYSIEEPYRELQIDLLFMPTDVGGFKYILTCVDAASRYKWAWQLKNKTASGVLSAFLKMDIPLNKVKKIVADDGSEFKGVFRQHIQEAGVEFSQADPSNHLPFVESFNRVLAVKLFEFQSKKELETNRVSKTWLVNLQPVVKKLNNTVTRLIGMKPKDAIKLDRVEQPENSFTSKEMNKSMPIGTVVRRLLNSDEILDVVSKKITVGRKRATDPQFSYKTYVVDSISKVEGGLTYHTLIESRVENHENQKGQEERQELKKRQTFWQLQKSNEKQEKQEKVN